MREKILKTRGVGLLFLGIIIFAVLLIIRHLTADGIGLTLPNNIQDLFTVSISVILESLPFIVLGILLSIALQLWLPKEFLFKRLPKNPFLRRMVVSLLGMFMPVCECGNVPLARGLMAKGLNVSDSLTFLLAAPILNPITIITTQQAFGNDPVILAARLLGGFVIANAVGWLFSREQNQESLLTEDFAAVCHEPDPHDHSHGKRLAEGARILMREANTIMPALFLGAFIAGAIQLLGPREILTVLGSDPVLSIFAMMALAFIVSICSNIDAFFALAFKGTFTAGSLVSFMVFGPMIDIKMIALMRTTYRTAVIWKIAGIVTLFSALIGLGVNYAF